MSTFRATAAYVDPYASSHYLSPAQIEQIKEQKAADKKEKAETDIKLGKFVNSFFVEFASYRSAGAINQLVIQGAILSAFSFTILAAVGSALAVPFALMTVALSVASVFTRLKQIDKESKLGNLFVGNLNKEAMKEIFNIKPDEPVAPAAAAPLADSVAPKEDAIFGESEVACAAAAAPASGTYYA